MKQKGGGKKPKKKKGHPILLWAKQLSDGRKNKKKKKKKKKGVMSSLNLPKSHSSTGTLKGKCHYSSVAEAPSCLPSIHLLFPL